MYVFEPESEMQTHSEERSGAILPSVRSGFFERCSVSAFTHSDFGPKSPQYTPHTQKQPIIQFDDAFVDKPGVC